MSEIPQSDDQFILSKSIPELLKLNPSDITRRQNKIRVLLLVYAKLHMVSDEIGWTEIDDIVFDELIDAIGDKQYQNWINRITVEKL